ncbi:hypothetical protein GCM10010501_56630 [Streptomyces libani subsp. rufus]|nr:hypothetical protein GCM10010501_56630 [Streptomyces libani subsp. rufus]
MRMPHLGQEWVWSTPGKGCDNAAPAFGEEYAKAVSLVQRRHEISRTAGAD